MSSMKTEIPRNYGRGFLISGLVGEAVQDGPVAHELLDLASLSPYSSGCVYRYSTSAAPEGFHQSVIEMGFCCGSCHGVFVRSCLEVRRAVLWSLSTVRGNGVWGVDRDLGSV